MQIRGITFVGTRTDRSDEMAVFARDVLGLVPVPGDQAAFFGLPDGTTFAVSPTDSSQDAERTVGFLVDDAKAAG